MAIYHYDLKIIGRSQGRSAVAAAAYRAGEKIENERDGLVHDYTRKSEVAHKEILAPQESPEWVYDRKTLWNAVEKVEKRKDSQLAKEVQVALPVELSRDAQVALLREYVQDQFVSKGMIVDLALHDKNDGNPHAHIMLTTRDITPDGFGKKNRSWNPDFANQKESNGFVKDAEQCIDWRAAWADHANLALERSGIEQRIDHRSFERQGITDRLPTIHEGSVVREMEKRGIKTEVGDINRGVMAHNSMVVDLKSYAEERQKLKNQPVPKTFNEVDSEWNRLYNERKEIQMRMNRLETQVKQIQEVWKLQNDHRAIQVSLDEVQPKNLWQRMTKTNESLVHRLESDMKQIETLIKSKRDGMPSESNLPKINSELSGLQGTFKALDRVFQGLDQERNQMIQEQRIERFKQQAKAKYINQDQELER